VVQKVVKRTSGQPPKFLRPIQPSVVREGESCEFTAAVSGVPVPEISWLKDKVDLVLVPGRHIAGFNPDTGECSLIINRAEPGDVGVYSCRATNVAGRATCTANVVVVRKFFLLQSVVVACCHSSYCLLLPTIQSMVGYITCAPHLPQKVSPAEMSRRMASVDK